MEPFKAALPVKKPEVKKEALKQPAKKEDKTPSEGILVCDGCGKEILPGKAKYMPRDEDTVMVLCPVCSGRAPKPKVLQMAKIKSKKIFKCTRCDYEFRFDPKGSALLKCPYCGRNDRLKEHIPAEEIIKGIKPTEENNV